MFLDTLWVRIDVTVFGEVTRKAVFRDGSAVSESTMVAVVGFVASGHCSMVIIKS